MHNKRQTRFRSKTDKIIKLNTLKAVSFNQPNTSLMILQSIGTAVSIKDAKTIHLEDLPLNIGLGFEAFD